MLLIIRLVIQGQVSTVHGFHRDSRHICKGKRRKALVYMVHIGPLIFSDLSKNQSCFDSISELLFPFLCKQAFENFIAAWLVSLGLVKHFIRNLISHSQLAR